MALHVDIRRRLAFPIFAAPMVGCGGPELAAACSRAGIVGSLSCLDNRGVSNLEGNLHKISCELSRHEMSGTRQLSGPIAVNLSPAWCETEFRDYLKVCRRYGVDIIITSVGNPCDVAPMIKEAGLFHFHAATSVKFAEKAARAGVDGLICVCAGGGGHSGTMNPMAFVREARSLFGGTLAVGGAISDGEGIRAAEVLGADLAYMGTRFIATQEAEAASRYKAMLLRSDASEIVYSNGVDGLPGSWLKPSLREAGLDPDNMPSPSPRSTAHLPDGVSPFSSIWSAGQGVGLIEDLPLVSDLVARLRREYIAAVNARSWLLSV
ncbi:MAG TPA: nitronate monooxygenase [Sphingobium sp.]|uniref:NAD(P)H-dependent flavin oxidoreductase n=1 Tax=Sphingobium sp. TaxID=1912891 RepID=UPI002ED2C614